MTRARRAALHAVVALVACGQVAFVLELCGLRLGYAVVLGIESVVVLAATLAARKKESFDLALWALIGVGVWIFWGTLYFGAARITDPPNARTFDDAILAHLPVVPAFTAVYLGVHIFSIVPYCALDEARTLRRYLLGNLLLVLLSAIAWVTLPVRLDRPPLPPEPDSFGMWLLHVVYRADPTTNCFPSAHCGVAVYAAIGLRAASRPLFVWGIATAIAICVSTVMTRQHYVADVLAGAVLAGLMSWAMARRR
jgi:hypothetical protein